MLAFYELKIGTLLSLISMAAVVYGLPYPGFTTSVPPPMAGYSLRRAFGINPTANGMGSSFAYYAYLLHTPPLNTVYMCFLSRVAEGHFPLIQS